MLRICIAWELVGVDEPDLEDSELVQGDGVILRRR